MFNNQIKFSRKRVYTISYSNGEINEWAESETFAYYTTKEVALADLKAENGHIKTRTHNNDEILTLFDEKEQRLYEYRLYTKELEEGNFFTLYEDNIIIEFNGKRYYRDNSYYFIRYEDVPVI